MPARLPGVKRAGLRWLLAALLALLLQACDSGGVSSSCSLSERNRFVHRDLLNRYLWYQALPQIIDYERFVSPSATLDYLRNATLDRFSYITSQAAFDSLFGDGSYIGFGFSYAVDGADRVRLRFVYRQSPAAAGGMLRGDEILAINGESVDSIIAGNRWSEVLGPAQIGVAVEIELRKRAGGLETVRLVKDRVAINAVLYSAVFDIAADRVGYLVFSTFIGPARSELEAVFDDFQQAGVNRLILDLRYNGGGALDVARDLGSLIHRVDNANQDLFLELRYNDKLQDQNYRFYFRPEPRSLGLDDLVVITAASSCSASEQLVSALTPYVSSVTTVGATTCGKPVGMNPRDFCDSTLVAVNFAAYNAADQGDYFDGIPADCPVADDTGFDFGESGEPMLDTARYYIENATCPVAPRSAGKSPLPPPPPAGLHRIHGAV